MHRVTQGVVRVKIDPEQQRGIFSNMISIIAAAWPAPGIGSHDIALWDASEAIYPHVTSLGDAYRKYFKREDADSDFEFATLLTRVGW
jgi:hypothetical protein